MLKFKSKGFFHGPLIKHTKKNPNRKIHRFLSPSAITNLERHIKHRWPIRWHLQQVVPHRFRVKRMQMNDFVWKVKRILCKKYRYNVVYLSTLSNDYHDIDTRMFHSVFTLFVQFMENNYDNIIWDETDLCDEPLDKHQLARKKAGEEMHRIYHWWKSREVSREREMEALDREMDGLFKDTKSLNESPLFRFETHKHKNSGDYLKYHELLNTQRDIEEAWEREDTDNMISVIKLRGYMW